jgi:hypothetical protein
MKLILARRSTAASSRWCGPMPMPEEWDGEVEGDQGETLREARLKRNALLYLAGINVYEKLGV